MDKEVRKRIQRATGEARRVLEDELGKQLDGVFDIGLDGVVAPGPGEHLDAGQRELRKRLVAAVLHHRAAGLKPAEAVAAYLREAAFTTLNRFVALKMLEARGLVQACLSRGEESAGFKEFVGLAPGLLQLPDHGYRLYIESLFDEIGREVRVLFDRRDPASLLWPRRQALAELLAILNAPELANVWGEDETIGWVYQYFNGDDERAQMRDVKRGGSQAPRNSRELAVRNQFFTPRYVVEFLVDNTLGRIWYEMRGGDTALADRCAYLVRQEGEQYEPRAKKDPRDLKVLDPACGSGHFLLYAFDLLVVIYEEAWAEEGSGLREDYATLEELRRAVPGLILRENLHGIDIDLRAAQIAALALWMRAVRAYGDFGIGRGERPAIVKTNIACAEPMPGEADLRQEFVDALAAEDAKLADLVGRVFETMKLAGEAGALLKIETDIERAIRHVYGAESGVMFPQFDKDRWQRAEAKLLDALKAYADRAQNGHAYARRLFADDAARGLAFIDLCRQTYDVVVMNPPFGAGSMRAKKTFEKAYPKTKNDVYAAFVERGIDLLHPRGRLGAITSRTGFFLSSFQKWREDILLKKAPPAVVADLGYGVMDDAMVEAAAYCLEVSP